MVRDMKTDSNDEMEKTKRGGKFSLFKICISSKREDYDASVASPPTYSVTEEPLLVPEALKRR